MNSFKKFVFIVLSSFLGGCALSPLQRSVIMRTDEGELMAIGIHRSEGEAILNAVENAKSYCANRNEAPVFDQRSIKKMLEKSRHVQMPLLLDEEFFSGVREAKVGLGFRCAPT